MTTPIFIYLSRQELIFGDFSESEPVFSSLKRAGESLSEIFAKVTEKFAQNNYHFILDPDHVYTIELTTQDTVSRDQIRQLTIPHIPELFSDPQFDYVKNKANKYTSIVIPQTIYSQLNQLKDYYPELSFSTSSAQAHANTLGISNTNPSKALFIEAKRALKQSFTQDDSDGLTVSISPPQARLRSRKALIITSLIILILGTASILISNIQKQKNSSIANTNPSPSPTPIASATISPTPTVLDQSHTSILVLNSTNTAGLAKQVQLTLERGGYSIIEIGNHEDVLENTVVYSSKDLSSQDQAIISKLLSPRLPTFESKLPDFDISENKHDIVIVLGIN